MRNMEACLFNNKELHEVIRKTKKVSIVLMIDSIAIEENLNVDFSSNPHRFIGLCCHCPTMHYMTA